MKRYLLAVVLIAFNFLLNETFAQENPVDFVKEEPKDKDVIVDFPDVEAQFKGGNEEMTRFISSNVHYPFEARKNNIQGRVFISFIVRKNGKLTDIKIERGVHPSLDDAAKEVIEMMPRWKPAEKDGKKVNCKVMLPIAFQLD